MTQALLCHNCKIRVTPLDSGQPACPLCKRALVAPGPPPPDYILGLDLGQAADYSALVCLAQTWKSDPRRGEVAHYAVNLLHRWPLGTSYTLIAAGLCKLVAAPPFSNPRLAVDQTGVGRAVVNMFQTVGVRAYLRPILITSGHAVAYGSDGSIHLPKKELVSVLQVVLQSRRLAIPNRLVHARTLASELKNFRVKVTTAGNETFEAWRERDHDDLVLALAMALWLGERHGRCDPPRQPTRRPFDMQRFAPGGRLKIVDQMRRR